MDYFNLNATESSKHAVGFPVRGNSLVHMNGHILADGRLVVPIFLPARTAQGGGGSFKDRTPTGEVPCCAMDGRANPLMDRGLLASVGI